MKVTDLMAITVASFCLTQIAHAEPAQVKTPAPVIYLEDNLDEVDGLGWCIDTAGRGYSEFLHAHSCKPQGGDVQFSYDEDSMTLRSVAFAGKCATELKAGAKTTFGLSDCDDGDAAQHFDYDAETLSLRSAQDAARCIAVGADSRSAGPFMSRDLVWADCASADPILHRWIIRN